MTYKDTKPEVKNLTSQDIELPAVISEGDADFQPDDPGILIPLLQQTQERFGYLPRQEIIRICSYLDIPEARVYGVATFYNQFRFEPLGKYLMQICMGTACHVKGASEIFSTLKAELDIEDGETTDDGLFTLDTVACLGACSMAPVVLVGDDFYGDMDPQKALKLVRDIRAREGS